jgi:hypothetical protein
MKARTSIFISLLIFLGLAFATANAEVHERHVRFTLDASQLTAISSGGLDVVELSTGFSETFKPAQLTGTDMLNVHVEFFDTQGNQLYVVLRDLGGGYLNAKGWQWFQAAASLDLGTVSGTYVNGWVFTESLPVRPGNAACCTISVSGATTIQSAGFGFNVTDSSIAIESMRIQFNFNSYLDPVSITDGGGFDRLSLKMRSEDIALLRMPQTTPLRGPWGDDGVALDVDGDGVVDSGSGDQKIGIDYGVAQHFRHTVTVFPGVPDPDGFSYPIFLADGFLFDPLGEENFDGCKDGVCDGISQGTSNSCDVTISGPEIRKAQVEPRYAVIEPPDPFSGTLCAYNVHIVTSGEKKGRYPTYEPGECRTADATGGGSIDSLVKLTNGVQIYDKATETLLPENLGEQLVPVGCL